MLSESFKLFWKTVERKDARRINSQTPPTEIEQFCDIRYIDDGLWQHRLDVYSKSGTPKSTMQENGKFSH